MLAAELCVPNVDDGSAGELGDRLQTQASQHEIDTTYYQWAVRSLRPVKPRLVPCGAAGHRKFHRIARAHFSGAWRLRGGSPIEAACFEDRAAWPG